MNGGSENASCLWNLVASNPRFFLRKLKNYQYIELWNSRQKSGIDTMLQIERKADQAILIIDSILNFGEPSYTTFETALEDLRDSLCSSIVIDFFKCSSLDTQAVSSLVAFNNELKKGNRSLKITNANGEIRDMLKSTKNDQFLEFC
jgi:anti-anti-sigma regulatory factor